MLLALVLSGLAAAIVAPFALSGDENDNDDAAGAAPDDADAQCGQVVGELLDVADPEALGEIYEIRSVPGAYAIEDFDPAHDSFVVRMADADAVIETGWEEDGTPYLFATTSEGEVSVEFPGLADVPADAVVFVVPHSDGSGDIALTLTEILLHGLPTVPAPGSVTFVLDGGAEHPASIFEDTLEDLADLLPLGPGGGDDVDVPTLPLDDLVTVGPAGGDDADVPPDPLPGLVPMAPGSGEETDP